MIGGPKCLRQHKKDFNNLKREFITLKAGTFTGLFLILPYMHKRILLLVAICACLSAAAQNGYPGAALPGDKPAVFARGTISDGMNNRDFTISPNGDEIFYSVQQRDFSISTILRFYKKK